MGRRGAQTWGVGVVGAVLAATLLVTPAAAEYCRPVMPDQAEDVRGYAFLGSVTGVKLEGAGPALQYSLAVERVYRNPDHAELQPGRVVELYSNACDGFARVGVRAGDRVLISSQRLDGENIRTATTAVWRVEGEVAELLVLAGADFPDVWFTDDRRLLRAGTVADALALVAPEGLAVPDTGASDVDGEPLAFVMAMVAAITLAFVVLVAAVAHRVSHRPAPPAAP